VEGVAEAVPRIFRIMGSRGVVGVVAVTAPDVVRLQVDRIRAGG
jgi:hypothetical protein